MKIDSQERLDVLEKLSAELREKLRGILLACIAPLKPVAEDVLPESVEGGFAIPAGAIPVGDQEFMEEANFAPLALIPQSADLAPGDMMVPVPFYPVQDDGGMHKHLEGDVSVTEVLTCVVLEANLGRLRHIIVPLWVEGSL